MENVRREVRVGARFTRAAFERAFATFREFYNIAPQRVLCAPDVLLRYCELYESSPLRALEQAVHLRHAGVPLVAAVLAPGTVAFEGEVDEERMGDW
ncbi:MAG: hypothetical protein GIX03_12725 [Candidatus Eremiobacteraeota bacterium]|nr:hypothetical protein [Candidatus Eremiobacteraeota bacterium]MBC5803830.1 hypothetical protein [Candidatus Eremiobacteraeota bacterium]MBC5822420.1 hypothetical protein [Candidatus Eremiobacteraeota bacterium]